MSGAEPRTPTARPHTLGPAVTGSREGSSYAPEGEGRHPAPHEEHRGLRALAARLEALAARARAERWPGFTAEDGRVLDAAARELATFEDALAQGMQEAFAIGREHGEREALLDQLNEEIALATGRLARQAWGRRRRGPPR